MGVPVPAESTVYVGRHASHTSCALEAAGLDRFLTAVAGAAPAADTTDPTDTTATATVTVDARSVAGRERRPGAPARCRRLHRATTTDPAWPPAARDRLANCLDTE